MAQSQSLSGNWVFVRKYADDANVGQWVWQAAQTGAEGSPFMLRWRHDGFATSDTSEVRS